MAFFDKVTDMANGAVDKMVPDYKVIEKLTERGYSPDVARALLQYGATGLNDMDTIDNDKFASKASENDLKKSPAEIDAFKAAAESVRSLAKRNVTFATSVADVYRGNRDVYVQRMENLANAMYANPEFAKRVKDLADNNKVGELIKIGKNPDKYLGSNAPAQATPGTNTVQYSAAPQTQTGPSNGGQVKPPQRTPSGASSRPQTQTRQQASAPVDTPDDDAPVTSATALDRFGKLMSDPNNKLAKAIKAHQGLEGELKTRIEKAPNFIKNLESPSSSMIYLAMLQSGNTNGFLNKFAVPDVVALPGMPDLGKIGDTLMGALDIFKGFGNGMGEAGELLGRVVAGLGLGGASMGPGVHIAKALGDFRDYMQSHGGDVLQIAVQNAQSNHPELKAYGVTTLKEAGVVPELMDGIIKGDISGINHAKVTFDAKGKPTITGEPIRVASLDAWARDKVQQVTTPNPDILSPEERRQRTDAVPPGTVLPAGLQPSGAVTGGIT